MFEAVVCSNRQIGPGFYRIRLEFPGEGAKIFARFKPGQFAEFDLSTVALPAPELIPESLRDVAGRNILLRRPFSFCEVTSERGRTFAELLYCVVGPATVRMMTLSPGDSISVIGPLGNGFHIPKEKKRVLLISGGMGTPPLQHLAQVLSSRADVEIIAFAGAKTAKALPFESRLDEISQQLGFSIPEYARYGVESLIATDDGSAGYHGFVTDCLLTWLGETNPAAEETIICACGPEVMLARVAEIAIEKNIDCQVSMERRMACGINLCQGCAIECRIPGSNETLYKMCCQDGPIFDGREVVF
ncbi:MAG: dihydroorotate dehydrogenase electron transfer subunit [Sedimentisphaerales bacterium]|nr:dihydroorotate dehydrogenase electron transfer subunit [Sedimentisphaerales bacterium]